MVTAEQIAALQKKVSDAKLEVARIEGQITSLMDELANKYDLHSVEQADEYLNKLEDEEQRCQSEIECLYKQLESKYGPI